MNGASYRLDVALDTATLSVFSALDQTAMSSVLGRCRELPSHVVTLQLDLRPLGAMGVVDGEAVRLILHAWRQSRGGAFQLTTSHLVATCRQIAAPPAAMWAAPGAVLPASSRWQSRSGVAPLPFGICDDSRPIEAFS